MRNRSRVPFIAVVVLVGATLTGVSAACGSATSSTGTPVASSTSAATSASVPATPHATAAPSANPNTAGHPPLRWDDYPGPIAKLNVTAPRIWATRPIGYTWDVLGIYQHDRIRSEADAQVIGDPGDETWVPNALVADVSTEKAKVGDRVLAQLNSGLSALYAKVTKIGEETITVRSVIIDNAEDTEIEPAFVIPLRGTAAFGAPAVFPSEIEDWWDAGILVYLGPSKAWVLGSAGDMNLVDANKIHLVDTSRTFAIGTKVMARHAARGGRLGPGVVSAILEDGLRYRVAFDATVEGGEEIVGYEAVTIPFH
jgi:hypothetical protein